MTFRGKPTCRFQRGMTMLDARRVFDIQAPLEMPDRWFTVCTAESAEKASAVVRAVLDAGGNVTFLRIEVRAEFGPGPSVEASL